MLLTACLEAIGSANSPLTDSSPKQDSWIWLFIVYVRRNELFLKYECCLDNGCETTDRPRVANVGLDRTNIDSIA